jgi:hypothetical protein
MPELFQKQFHVTWTIPWRPVYHCLVHVERAGYEEAMLPLASLCILRPPANTVGRNQSGRFRKLRCHADTTIVSSETSYSGLNSRLTLCFQGGCFIHHGSHDHDQFEKILDADVANHVVEFGCVACRKRRDLCADLSPREKRSGRLKKPLIEKIVAGPAIRHTDGLPIYKSTIPLAFGWNQPHAQVVKIFGKPVEGEARYSPAEIIDLHVEVGGGNPNVQTASTSFVERSNKTLRMQIRRFTRLTDGHSKKWENHEAAIALFVAYYNFCRVHSTLGETPATAAGLTDHVWSVRELLEKVAAGVEC